MSLSTLHTTQLRAVLEANQAYEATHKQALAVADSICCNVLSTMFEVGALDDEKWESAWISDLCVGMFDVKAKIRGRNNSCIKIKFEVGLLDLDVGEAAEIVADRVIKLRHSKIQQPTT